METKINKIKVGWDKLKQLFNNRYVPVIEIKKLNNRGIEVYY